MSIILNPEFLLPKKGVDYSKWAVIACDQFTSQREYWESVKEYVGDAPSALNMIFPEAYLSEDNEARIHSINENMRDMLDSDFFDVYKGFVLVERTLANGHKRLGLMIAVDLEAYEYTPDTHAPIRATERTVVERLPIRVDIRRNAVLELPHIMLLMNDPTKSIIEELYEYRDEMWQIYDFDLNMNGGHITGYFFNDDELIERIEHMSHNELLFAVGDGNHSLATAKECWNEKRENGLAKHSPHARYAMCELVNLYDDSLEFAPIHRIIKGQGVEFIREMQDTLQGDASIVAILDGVEYNINVDSNASDAIKDIQDFIDARVSGTDIDYIHGDEYVREVASREGAIAIMMPTIENEGLFDYVERRGVLPRKAFSMGEAEDKRYYVEARRIN